MATGSYPYIDIAALDAVRGRFAAGDALAILSTDLEDVIWVNGAGAALFGHDDIASIIGGPSGLAFAARRQVMATPGYPDIGSDRPVFVRLASGLTSRTVQFLASRLAMPDGESAILLSVPATNGARSERETAAQAIGGLAGQDQFVALVDGGGEVLAATPDFDALGISGETLSGLVADARGDRLIKRRVAANGRRLPAGFVRLTDEPARHLLFVVDEGEPEEPVQEDAPRPAEHRSSPPFRKPVLETTSVAAVASAISAMLEKEEPVAQPASVDRWYFHGDADAGTGAMVGGAAEDERRDEPLADDRDIGAEVRPDDSSPQVDRAPQIDGPQQHGDEIEPAAEASAPGAPTRERDDLAERLDVHSTGDDNGSRDETPAVPDTAEPPTLTFERITTPVRFVWRTDAAGRFSAVSPEFATAVGPQAANVVGMAFRDAAASFGIDPDGEIAGLLERRDTWSGRTVLWPVAGAALRIPVDLAALPAYDRNRNFEGFRGFGVARGGEAVEDAQAAGLRLTELPKEAETPQAEPAVEDRFKGEVPALAIEDGPERRFTDKVIRLAERREPANDRGPAPGSALSAGERNAFREIGDRLKTETQDAELAGIEEAAREAQAHEASDASAAEGHQIAQEQPSKLLEAEAPDASHIEAANDEPIAAIVDEVSEVSAEDVPNIEAPAEGIDEPFDSEAASAQAAGPGAAQAADEHFGTIDEGNDTPNTETPAEPVARTEADFDGHDPKPAAAFTPSAFATADKPRAPVDTSILDQLPVPVLIHAGDNLFYANREFLDLTGYDSLELLEEAGGLGEIFGEPYQDESGREGDRKLRLRTAEGLEFPVEALLQSVPWASGKALLLSLRRVGRASIPAQRSDRAPVAAAQLAQNAELEARVTEMRAILDTATDGVVLIAPDGTIRSISRAAEALFGLDSAQVAGKHFSTLFAIESQRAARDYLSGLTEHGVASVLNDGREVIGREAQGGFIPLFMTIGRLPDGNGFCAVMRDITQWKRAEEDLTQARAQAERASSQKTDFLARVSHEIRTPLNAIIGFSELMLDEKFGSIGNDRYRDYLRDINRSGNHVLDLVNDLLDISKIEAGQQEMEYEAVSLNDTLAETVAMMQPQANRERVIIRSSFASRLPEVVADLRSVRQIALNLLSNAIRYTQAGGQVIVSTAYEAAGDVVMRVRDTGIGMSSAEIEQALKPFKQINALKRGRGDGTGLGLPLTKAMVEANRARFTINSTPGEGTMVEVTFPPTRVLAD